ncbi:cadherin-like domain-containing protein [Ferrimonas balearica]|nr:multiheme c-type cytochrome [Ferrimonas balearica]MBW3138878.1 cadherin-like domain-containing protein [Ferrimonas balearica]
MKKFTQILFLTTPLFFGCGSDDSNDTSNNTPPIASPDVATLYQGETAVIDVLANDSDPDGDALSVVSASGLLIENDMVVFTAAEDESIGDQVFSYTITDGELEASSTITITVKEKEGGQPPLSRGEYVGSEACATCHQGQYQDWMGTKHARVLRKLYTEEGNTIDAPWGTEQQPHQFTDVAGNRYTSYTKDGEYWVTIHDGQDSTKDLNYRIDAVGYKTEILFFSYDEAKEYLVFMPFVFWPGEETEVWTNAAASTWFNPDGTLISGPTFGVYRDAASFDNRCMECHSTNLEIAEWKDSPIGYPVVKSSNSLTAEWGVGCEKCHGPGAAHTRSMDKSDIVNPADLTGDKKGSACYSCHNSVRPSNEYPQIAFAYQFNADNPLDKGQHFNVGDRPDDFYIMNDRKRWAGVGYLRQSKTHPIDFLESQHGQMGMECSSCHNAHTMELKKEGDAQCVQCHSDKDSESHKMAIHDMVGAECADCHMTWSKHSVDRSRRYDARSHNFKVHTPSDSLTVYDTLLPYTQGEADPDAELTKTWQLIQESGKCYENWKYPENMKFCTEFDIMPNACSSCHQSEMPKPGVFNDDERNKLLEGEKRYQRFLDAQQ